MYTHIYIYIYINLSLSIYIYIHTYIHIYIYIYIYGVCVFFVVAILAQERGEGGGGRDATRAPMARRCSRGCPPGPPVLILLTVWLVWWISLFELFIIAWTIINIDVYPLRLLESRRAACPRPALCAARSRGLGAAAGTPTRRADVSNQPNTFNLTAFPAEVTTFAPSDRVRSLSDVCGITYRKMLRRSDC